MQLTVQELAEIVNGTVIGEGSKPIAGAQSIANAASTEITFVADEANLRTLAASQAGAVVISNQLNNDVVETITTPAIIVVNDPQAAFIEILMRFRPPRPRKSIGIAPAAHVDPSAEIGANTNIYPGAYIDEDVVIGENCDIHPGVHIGAGCRIGNDVVLHANAVLYHDVAIGNRVIVHASAVIGADGFGFRFADGRFHKLPHLGGVQIDDDVEIGACTTIDRAMIGLTVIGAGTKLDNLVMIAHNCEVGRHNAFASQVGMAGSSTTGDYVRCGGQSGIRDHVHLGTGCSLGAKTGVVKDIPAGETHIGCPARPESEQLRIAIAETKLPEMRKRLRALESHVLALTTEQTVKAAG